MKAQISSNKVASDEQRLGAFAVFRSMKWGYLLVPQLFQVVEVGKVNIFGHALPYDVGRV